MKRLAHYLANFQSPQRVLKPGSKNSTMCFDLENTYSCGHSTYHQYKCGKGCRSAKEYDIVIRVPCQHCHEQEAASLDQEYAKLKRARGADERRIRRLRARIQEMKEDRRRIQVHAQQIVDATGRRDARKRGNTADLRQDVQAEKRQSGDMDAQPNVGSVISELGKGVGIEFSDGEEGRCKGKAMLKRAAVDGHGLPNQDSDDAERLEEIEAQLKALLIRGQMLMDERKRIKRLVQGCGEHDPDGAVADRFLATPDECPGSSSYTRSWPSEDDAEDGEGLAGTMKPSSLMLGALGIGESHGT